MAGTGPLHRGSNVTLSGSLARPRTIDAFTRSNPSVPITALRTSNAISARSRRKEMQVALPPRRSAPRDGEPSQRPRVRLLQQHYGVSGD